MSEKIDKFMRDLHKPEYVPGFLFYSLFCTECKQGCEMEKGEIQVFRDTAEMRKFAKREHRKAPKPCVKPFLVITSFQCLLSSSIVNNPFDSMKDNGLII